LAKNVIALKIKLVMGRIAAATAMFGDLAINTTKENMF